MWPKTLSFDPCPEDPYATVLGEDRCRVTMSGHTFEVDARIVFRPHEFPSAQVELADLDVDVAGEEPASCYLSLSGLVLDNGRLSLIEGPQTQPGSRFSHRVRQTEPMILAKDAGITRFSALIYNTSRFSLSGGPSNGREELELSLPGGWTAKLGPPSAVGIGTDALQRLCSPWRQLTNSIQLFRLDHPPATGEEVHDLVFLFQYFLSFAWGRFVGIACGQAFSVDGGLVCAMPGTTHVEPRTFPVAREVHWFPPFRADFLKDIVAGFWARMSDLSWKDSIEWAVYWWLIANQRTQASESSILASQSGLETMSSPVLTRIGPLTAAQIPRTASGKIRAMLKLMRVPLTVPGQLGALASLASAEQWDGPTAVTRVRNSLAHPSRGSPAGLAFEASQLAMWYLELVLLFVFDYRGRMINRTSRDASPFDLELVPWA